MRAKRTDANQSTIAVALRRLGWQAIDLSGVGRGVPDLMVCRGESVRLVEVKTARGTLTPQQHAMVANGWPIVVVRTVQDAIDLR